MTAGCLLTFLLKWSACPCQYWLFRLATTDFSTSKDSKLMNGASCISHKCTVSTTFSFAMSFLLSSPSATATRIGLHVSWWSIHGRDCSLLLRLSVMTTLTSIRLKHFSHYNRVNPSIENGPLLSPFLPWFSKSLLSHWLGMGQSVLGSLLSNMFFLWNSTRLWLCTIDALFTTFFLPQHCSTVRGFWMSWATAAEV